MKNKSLYRIVVEIGGNNNRYPKYYKFWHIEKWNDKYESSNCGRLYTAPTPVDKVLK